MIKGIRDRCSDRKQCVYLLMCIMYHYAFVVLALLSGNMSIVNPIAWKYVNDGMRDIHIVCTMCIAVSSNRY